MFLEPENVHEIKVFDVFWFARLTTRPQGSPFKATLLQIVINKYTVDLNNLYLQVCR